jgi:hypothetical protein
VFTLEVELSGPASASTEEVGPDVARRMSELRRTNPDERSGLPEMRKAERLADRLRQLRCPRRARCCLVLVLQGAHRREYAASPDRTSSDVGLVSGRSAVRHSS